MSKGGFQLGTGFPHEGFVQQVLEEHFRRSGFVIRQAGDADLDAYHPQLGSRWIIEAKGETSSTGLDFRTGLGQLLTRMADPAVQYGLAVPDTPRFRTQLRTISPWVRKTLHLHWVLVGPDRSVRIYRAQDEV
ncbi:MAG: hypothetical protein ACOY93_07975 [Bacillota bacterium]